MKSLLIAGAVLTLWAVTTSTGWASWGWPAPGYSTTGVKASDGSQYRGLCKKTIRQWWCARKESKQAATMPLVELPAAEPLPAPRAIEK